MSLSNNPHIDDIQSPALLPDISPLLWIHGPGPRGSVLVILAQNGYTQEAHQIISLSRTASLIGRDSDGGLPELWDIMGRRKNKQGITRLMAICITRGSLSPQRVRALIRDHNVDVKATDKFGRTVLHHALGAHFYSDPWSMNPPINTDLIRVLIEACPDLVKMKDNNTRHPLYYACRENAPFDVIKLFIDIYPEGFKDISLNKLSSSTLVALAKEKAVKENSKAVGNVAWALGHIAESEPGRQSCIAARAPLALTELAKEKAVKENSKAVGNVAWALGHIAESEPGRQSCIAAGATLALTELAKEKAVKENSKASGSIAAALGSIAESEPGCQSFIAAGAPIALTELAKEKAVKENSDAAMWVAAALGNIAKSETGRQSCIDAGATLVLTELAKEKAVKENGDAARNVAFALGNIARSDTGRQSCIDAGAPLVLTELAKEKTVKEKSVAARNVAWALRNISSSDIGRQSCIDAGVPHSCIDWASKKSSRENDLIWIQGTGAANTGSILFILAQNGYTREAHQIISLSRTASLIGRDSDGCLPELWDIMGRRKNKQGITRLMAICITRGSLSPQRVRALIRDHNVDVKATDKFGRTVLHHALGAHFYSDPWSMNPPINTDLIRVLIEACPDLVKMKDNNTRHPLYYACRENAPFDVIKLFIDIYPEGFKDISLNKLSSSTLVALAKEKAVKENSKAVGNVAWALGHIAESEPGRQSCIAARAPLALTELAKEKAVKENSKAVGNVAWALGHIAESEPGRQSCIAAGATLALTELAKEKAVKENSKASGSIAAALGSIAESEPGCQSFIAAGAPIALTELAKEKAVKENSDAAMWVAAALGNIAKSETGRQSCIDAGATLVLTELAKEKAVKENGDAARNVAFALGNIARSDTGRQSCIDAGAPLVLTELAKEKTVKEKSVAARNVAWALRNISSSDIGRQSCIDAGVPHSCIDWASKKSSRENDLIWIQGTGAANTGSILFILAQNGYTREAHQIISLSRTASLIGRDSDGCLPELWDIMGRRKNKQGITRLMAICITRGSLSPQRVRALIRDHNVDVKATDKFGRTVLHHALGAHFYSDPWSMNPPINTDLIRVLIEACPDLVKMKDNNTRHPLYYACRENAPFDVIKLFIDIYPEGFKDISLNKLSSSTLVALAKEKAVKENSKAVGNVAWALGHIAESEPGRQSCIAARAPLALTELAKEKAVKENSKAVGNVAWALGHIAESEPGRQSCIAAGATLALTELAKEKAVKENSKASGSIAAALGSIAESEPGCQSFIAAGAPIALTELAKEKAVKENSDAAMWVAAALGNIAKSETGRQSCIDAGATLVLTELAKEKAVKENGDAARNVAFALGNIARSDTGRQSCIDAGAPLVLTELAKEKTVKEKSVAARNVAWALRNISSSDIGRQSCIDAGVPHSCIDWASKKSSRENDLIWIQGTGAANTGSILFILAQNGYTREAHQIISLSRTASLIGRDSDGGLPELWDIMGRRKNKQGITRLMAICITRGSLSPQRVRALIRDHNVDVKATDKFGRTVLHHALGAHFYSDPWSMNPPINTDLIRVLIEACPDLVKMKDNNTRHPLYYACRENAPFDVIKLFIDIYPEGFKDISLNKLSSSTLVALAKEKAVKENSKAVGNVAWALGHIAESEPGRQSCIAARAPLALTELAKEKAVKENSKAVGNVAWALGHIAESEPGRQSCIAAGATLALTELAKEKAVKENSKASGSIAAALGSIAESEPGCQSFIAAGAPIALTELAKEKAVKENSDAAMWVAAALGNIAKSETGRQSCIDAGATLVLTELAKEKAVKENGDAARNVAFALGNIARSDTGRQSCIDAGAPLVLTELAKEKTVKEKSVAARNVAWALRNISSSDIGRQSCIDAGVPHSCIDWASKKSSRENDLIWIQGTGAANTGSILFILAQNGYTREAHQIISLSRTASLIGRDSDGGLPELWDIMGRRKNKQGITRLMAICITRGSLSPQRVRALIRDHNVDVKATDKFGRTVLHHALGAHFYSDPWSMNPPINTDLIRVLIEACPDLVKMKDNNTRHPLYYACRENAPFDVIKLFIDIYPEGFKDISLNKLSSSTLVALAKEKAVKENSKAVGNVAWALGHIAESEPGRQSCIAARAPLALTELAKEKAVKENSDAARNVANALYCIAYSDTGRQSCIAAGATLALTELAKEKTVKENSDAAMWVAAAFGIIAKSESGRQSCIAAGATLALTELAKEKAMKENSDAVKDIANAYKIITGIELK
jgi:uncharacterized lipoprotein NlpE involved in copper resistance/uncharacterized protein YneF (UPF0154 family)